MGVIVNDFSAAKEFFLVIGLEVQGEWEMELTTTFMLRNQTEE
ncbi:putative lactoylglutathione lyase [Paenibacillus harenae]|nr:putative lactoylglutathione lyase [Paenibacillus harenae]